MSHFENLIEKVCLLENLEFAVQRGSKIIQKYVNSEPSISAESILKVHNSSSTKIAYILVLVLVLSVCLYCSF